MPPDEDENENEDDGEEEEEEEWLGAESKGAPRGPPDGGGIVLEDVGIDT